MGNQLPVHHDNPELGAQVDQALSAARAFTALGLTEVMHENGTLFSRDPSTGSTVVAAPGLLVRERATVVEVVVAKPGEDVDALIEATAGFTQKQRAAFVRLRQPSVSRRLKK